MVGIKKYGKIILSLPVNANLPHPIKLKNILGPKSRAGFKVILYELNNRLIIAINIPIKKGFIKLQDGNKLFFSLIFISIIIKIVPINISNIKS